MATIEDAVNGVIGVVGATSGFRYAVNHSATAAPGATAPHQLTFDRKVEAPPIFFMDDPDANYPGVFFEIVGPFPNTVTRGQHGECSFNVKVYVVAESTNSTRPKESGRTLALQTMENCMALDTLGLTWADSLEWLGLADDAFTQQLHLILPKFYAGCNIFRLNAMGLTF